MSMWHKTLATRADHDFLPAPESGNAREPKQRRLMAAALALLVVALAFVIYQDRDFWFPDTQDAEDQLEPVPVAAAATRPSTTIATALPAAAVTKPATPQKKLHAAKPATKGATPASPLAMAASATLTPPTSPVPAEATRTVLPPLEVEVIAGDTRRTVRPGTNSIHVDLQPGSPPRTIASSPAARAPETAASITANAAERVQMSAGTAEIVSQPVKPDYPMLARQMRVQGSVILQALIGRDGAIQDLHVLSGPTILADAAQEAVRQWRFKPHYIGSDAVETQAKITVNFTISTN